VLLTTACLIISSRNSVGKPAKAICRGGLVVGCDACKPMALVLYSCSKREGSTYDLDGVVLSRYYEQRLPHNPVTIAHNDVHR
jgi:hypothetical protein